MKKEALNQHHEQAVLQAARLAEDAIAAGNGDTDRVTLIDHGHASTVAVVDRQVAIKFPRNPHAALRNEFELFILNELGPMKTCATPKGLNEGSRSSWTALSFLDGDPMSYRQLRELTEPAQEALGVSIGKFAHELHSSLDTTAINKKRRELKLDQLDEAPWPIHFEQTVASGPFMTEQQHGTAIRVYDRWKIEMLNQSGEFVIHDDLHADNLLLHDDVLVGVLDFGEVTIGSPEQELRQSFWISEVAARAAISTYETCSGTRLNKELARLWSIMQELAAYSEYLQDGRYDHPSFLRSRSGLGRLIPEVDWAAGTER